MTDDSELYIFEVVRFLSDVITFYFFKQIIIHNGNMFLLTALTFPVLNVDYLFVSITNSY